MSETHPAIARYETRGNELLIGGTPVSRLAEIAGTTPFFAYDRAMLDRRVAELRSQLPEGLSLTYAVKANPMPALVGHMRGLVDGFDIASARELRVALDAGMPGERISFAGPGKRDNELVQAVAAGAMIEVESAAELERIERAGQRLGSRPRVALRVNPDFQLKGSGMRMGGGAQQFGIDAEEVPALLEGMAEQAVDFAGFHIFGGSQNLNAEILRAYFTEAVELVLRLSRHCPEPPVFFNMGGGFGIPYFPQDKPLDLGPVGRHIGEELARLNNALPSLKPHIELGRYLVGEAGVYICRVIDRKVSRGQVYLVTDGGLHHHLAATGNFGQKLRRNFPVAVATRMGEEASESATVAGCLCTPLDSLAEKAALPAAQPGDLVAVFQSGAYGRSASPSGFLSHPEAGEMLV